MKRSFTLDGYPINRTTLEAYVPVMFLNTGDRFFNTSFGQHAQLLAKAQYWASAFFIANEQSH
jgi:hypothetical protein